MIAPSRPLRKAWLAVLLAAAAACGSEPSSHPDGYSVPVVFDSLENGLKVVLSEDHTAPTVTVAVYYEVGFRIEPRGQTGFAHLFEHLMFQGSDNLESMEIARLVSENGGVLNGSTRHDFTNYFQVVPAHTLETMLWAEADRMRGLRITPDRLENQRDVVKNEVLLNVLNQPYGGFPWLDLPQAAFDNWHNAHNFYGDFTDLDAASLDDVTDFFRRYYAPDNAVVVVVGDFEPTLALEWIRTYFGDIPRGGGVERPDVSETPQAEERRASRTDPLANRPGLAFGYRMPDRGSDAYWAMGLLDQILLQGDDAWLHQELVQNAGVTGSVSGGIHAPLGNMYNYDGPTLWALSLIHDPEVSADSIQTLVEGVLNRVRAEGVDGETLQRARVKARSELYDIIEEFFGFGRADLLASFALFDDDPSRINDIEERFRQVTAEDLRRAAETVLRTGNRTVFTLEPGATEGGQR